MSTLVKMKKLSAPRFKSLFFALLLVVILFAAVFAVYQKLNADTSDDVSNAKQQRAAEKADVQQNKERLAANSQTNSSGESTAKNTQSNATSNQAVIITGASSQNSSVVVSSYVTGVFEDGGTCTLTLTKDSSKVERTATGLADANHTTCPTFTINNASHSALSAGEWTVTVRYSSAKYNATSQAQKLRID